MKLTDMPVLGTTVKNESINTRDAVHVAVIVVKASEKLYRGTPIVINPDDFSACNIDFADHVADAVVDPFIIENSGFVNEGELFWAFMYPGKYRSLRHNWDSDSLSANTNNSVGKIIQMNALNELSKLSEEMSNADVDDFCCPHEYISDIRDRIDEIKNKI